MTVIMERPSGGPELVYNNSTPVPMDVLPPRSDSLGDFFSHPANRTCDVAKKVLLGALAVVGAEEDFRDDISAETIFVSANKGQYEVFLAAPRPGREPRPRAYNAPEDKSRDPWLYNVFGL